MAGITTLSRNGTLTVYRTFSFRDVNNRPRNDKKIIAHKYLKTGIIVYTNYFIELLRQQSIPIESIKNIEFKEIPKIVDFGSFSKQNDIVIKNKDIADIENNIIDDNNTDQISKKKIIIYNTSNNNHYTGTITDSSSKILGIHLLLDQITSDIGLKKIIMKVFPDNWREILTLSYFLISTNEPVMYCQNWTDNYSTYFEKPFMQSQRINELFKNIKYSYIMDFFDRWMTLQSENKYLALDITSVSSFSKLISDIEFGYNRDDDNLAQLNICMLIGEKSGLPVFSSHFAGNINDMSILDCFLDQIDFLTNNKLKIVMDKRFYSQNNIVKFVTMKDNFKFLLPVPFITNISKNILARGKNMFNKGEAFKINNDILLGYSFIKNFDNNNTLKYCVYYNDRLYSQVKDLKYNEAITLSKIAKLDPLKYVNNKKFNKYLVFIKDKHTQNYSIKINYDKIEHDIENIGWLIIATNDLNLTYKDVIEIYRDKNVVENHFFRLKHNLDLQDLNIHNHNIFYGKFFIVIIGLIIISRIHNVMKNNYLYNKYTLIELIKSVEQLKIIKHKNNITFTPLSKQCLSILKIFNAKIDYLD
jgi:transposase